MSPVSCSTRIALAACGSAKIVLTVRHNGRGVAHHSAKAARAASTLRSVSAAGFAPCRATNSSRRITSSGSVCNCSGLRRKMRSRDTVKSVFESRDRISRSVLNSEVSLFSQASSVRWASRKTVRAWLKYSRIHSAGVVACGSVSRVYGCSVTRSWASKFRTFLSRPAS